MVHFRQYLTETLGLRRINGLDIPPFKDENTLIPSTKHVVEILPVQELRQVAISWPVVFQTKKEGVDMDLVKPDFYVTHLLGHEVSQCW